MEAFGFAPVICFSYARIFLDGVLDCVPVIPRTSVKVLVPRMFVSTKQGLATSERRPRPIGVLIQKEEEALAFRIRMEDKDAQSPHSTKLTEGKGSQMLSTSSELRCMTIGNAEIVKCLL